MITNYIKYLILVFIFSCQNIFGQTANAGPDQNKCNGQTNATLAGNLANLNNIGVWTIESGGTGSFSNINSPTSTFTPSNILDGTNPYILKWYIQSGLVISHIYTHGGTTGATYINDFVELHNRSNSTISLSGTSLQFSSATGNFLTTLPLGNATMPAGSFYLIKLGSDGANGAEIPIPDNTATTINMTTTGGKVALVNSTAALNCGNSTTTCSTANLGLIIDMIAYGNASGLLEGTGINALNGITSARRVPVGTACQDLNNNSSDFVIGNVTNNIRNSSSTIRQCSSSSSSDNVTITFTKIPTTNTVLETSAGTNNDGIICSGSTAQITATSGYMSYSWSSSPSGFLSSDASITVSPTVTTTYTCTITSSDGCTATSSRVITVLKLSNTNVSITENSSTPNDNQICKGDSATLTVSGANLSAYLWSPSTSLNSSSGSSVIATPTITTTYTVTITGTNGCTATNNLILTVDNILPLANAGSDVTITCTTPTAVLAASGGASYVWNNGATQNGIVSPATTTTYTVTATGANGCTATDNVIVTVNKTTPLVNAGSDVTITCTTPTTVLAASGGASYVWHNSVTQNGTVSPATTTTYTVTATGANGCTATDEIIVTVDKTAPLANAGPDVTITCTTPNTVLAASGGVSYVWNNGATQNGTVSPATATTYIVTVTGANGCKATDNLTITIDKTIPLANAGADVTVTCTTPTTVLAASGGASYTWNNGATQNGTVSPATTTTYTVTATGANGCTATDVMIVTVDKVYPASFTVSGGGYYDYGGTGINIMLSGSEIGVSYQLKNDINNIGAAVAGTGSAINFSNQKMGGIYTVVATKTAGSCTATMTGTATITSDFVTLWNTESSTSFTIPTSPFFNNSYNYTIKWEQVNNPSINGTLTNQTTSTTISGLTANTMYRVKISGTFRCFGGGYLNATESNKLKEISQWGTINWNSMEASFAGCKSLEVTALDVPNLKFVTSTYQMFQNSSNMTGETANWNWNTSTLTDISSMFASATNFNGNIGSWNISNVTTLRGMFVFATKFNQPIGGWDTKKVVDMVGIFHGAKAFNQDISAWNTSSATNMGSMFSSAESFNQPIGNWDLTNVTSIADMFSGAKNFNQPIGNWNTANVKNFYNLFLGATKFNQPIGNWNTANVTDMSTVFANATDFNQDISSWNTGKVTVMYLMFMNAASFNQPIGNWNTSSLVNATGVFNNAAKFNQPIGNWNTANVTNMSYMFSGASMFNQPIGNWNTANVTNMSSMFAAASMFNQPISNWNTANVTNMSSMFSGAVEFNQDISLWSVNNVTNMSFMFYNTANFNQDINVWNTGNVTNMIGLFYGAVKFNRNLGAMNIKSVTDMTNILSYSGISCSNYANTLIGWANGANTPSNIKLGAVNIKFNSIASAARNTLINTKGWMITGDAVFSVTLNVVNNCGNSIIFPNYGLSKFLWSDGSTSSYIVVTNAGLYTITASDTGDCEAVGSTTAAPKEVPTIYPITGGGYYCTLGAAIGISNSQIGVNYQLERNSISLPSTTIAGTGDALSFGNQTEGYYRVISTNTASGCSAITPVSIRNVLKTKSISLSNLSGCNNPNNSGTASDDYCTANVTVNFNYVPSSGYLTLSRGGTVIASKNATELVNYTSWTFTGVQMAADGQDIYLTVDFGDNCPVTSNNLGKAPAACSMSGVLSGSATICAGASAAIAVTITGGESPYTVVYTDGTNSTTITNYTSGASIVVSPLTTKTYSLVSISDAFVTTNGISGTATITVDETLPAINLATVPNNVTVDCNNIPTAPTVTATNVCSTVTLSETSTKGTDNTQCSFYNYTITRTWTATDKRGNTNTASQTITVKANGVQGLTPLPNITVTEPMIPASATLPTNPCILVGSSSFTETRVNGTPPPCFTYAYTLNRIWTINDICGNTINMPQTIYVRGIRLTCPSDKTINTNQDAVADYNNSTLIMASLGLTPVFLDNCSLSTLRYEMSGATTLFGSGSVSGTVLQKGTTQIKYNLLHNGPDFCTFNITVKDNEVPKITVTPTSVVDGCSFADIAPNNYLPTAIDNATANPTLEVMSDVTADISGCATKTATLKYTKSLTRTWKATDENGNTAIATQKFFLRDMVAPTANCKIPTVIVGNTNVVYAANNFNDGSSDNCTSSSSLTFKACLNASCTSFQPNVILSKGMIPAGTNQADVTVNVQVLDACNNASVKTTKVTLKRPGTMANPNNGNNSSLDTQDTEASIPAEASAIPTVQGEMKCFPNPFSEDLNIQYNLTENIASVMLKVYDNQGRLVKTMEQAEQLAGFYQIRWSLSDLSSGMYHVCLELNGKCTKMERVIMMK
jgi:surface protein